MTVFQTGINDHLTNTADRSKIIQPENQLLEDKSKGCIM